MDGETMPPPTDLPDAELMRRVLDRDHGAFRKRLFEIVELKVKEAVRLHRRGAPTRG